MAKPTSLDWGPNLTSVSYELLLEGSSYGELISLACGYGLGQPEFDKTDAIKRMFNCLENGRIVPRTMTVRGAIIRERNYPLLLPSMRTLYTPLTVLFGNNCPRDVFLRYLCPDDIRHAHVRHFHEVTFDEAEETSVLVEGVEGGAPLTAQSMMHTFKSTIEFYITAHEQQTDADGPAHAIAFEFPDCVGCNPYEHRNLLYGGDEYIKRSTNAGASGTGLTVTLPATAIVEDLLVDGDLILAVFSILTTDGGIRRSIDGGTSFAAVGPTTAPLYDLFKANGLYWAVGGEGVVLYSTDGATWTAVATGLATAVYHMGDVDPDTGIIYIAGVDAAAGVLLSIVGTSAVTNLSSLLPGSPASLLSVKVLEPGHVAVGGAAGYFAEQDEISDGTAFANGTVGAGNVRGIIGSPWRTIVSSGAEIYVRDIDSDLVFGEIPYDTGSAVAGEIYALAEGNNALGINYGAFATATGEIGIIYPAYPQAI